MGVSLALKVHPPQPQAGVPSAGSGAPHGPARPSGRPKGGPTAPPARSGPARTQRSPPARPPDSVSPGSPQLPVVFLLFEQLPRLRHGRERPANSRNAAESHHHERAGALRGFRRRGLLHAARRGRRDCTAHASPVRPRVSRDSQDPGLGLVVQSSPRALSRFVSHSVTLYMR